MTGFDFLTKIGACSESMAWAKTMRGRTMEEAWNACPYASWMAWLIARIYSMLPSGVDRADFEKTRNKRWHAADLTISYGASAKQAAAATAKAIPWRRIQPFYLKALAAVESRP